jgi:hypothetical protein
MKNTLHREVREVTSNFLPSNVKRKRKLLATSFTGKEVYPLRGYYFPTVITTSRERKVGLSCADIPFPASVTSARAA